MALKEIFRRLETGGILSIVEVCPVALKNSTEFMKPTVKYILLPLIAPLMIVGLYYTPLTVISCKARGWVALAIALLSANAAFVAIWHGYSARFRRDPVWLWWFFSALIYTSPLVLLLGPLG